MDDSATNAKLLGGLRKEREAREAKQREAKRPRPSSCSSNEPIVLSSDDDEPPPATQQAAAAGSGSAAAAATWACPRCTLNNDPWRTACEACGRSRAGATSSASLTSMQVSPAHLTPALVTPAHRWITWRGGLDDPKQLSAWLKKHKPSLVSRKQCDWISVNSPTRTPSDRAFDEAPFAKAPYLPVLDGLRDAINRSKRLKAGVKEAASQKILTIAREQRLTTGKWMLRLYPGQEADDAWEAIAHAVMKGKLGDTAKIAPTLHMEEKEKVTVCCVYARDFGDRAEVQRLLLALQRVVEPFGLRVTNGFKPDVFTMLGINQENEWRLAPTIYSVEDVKKWL